jgi:membrane protease YdiL (CAAX protease family)
MDTVTAATTSTITLREYSPATVLGIWALAAVPMAAAAWVVAPAIADPAATPEFLKALLGALTAGLLWQMLVVAGFVAHEQRSLRWTTIRRALWLGPPTDATGRRGGRLWWWALPLIAGFGAVELTPLNLSAPAERDFGVVLSSESGQALLRGNWGLLALIVAMLILNTVLGEEMLFRGLLLPRMRAAFGRADWVVNGVLFGVYHLHQPWSIPGAVVRGLMAAYATRRLHSAWLGIIAHSAQSVVFLVLTLAVVLAT